MKNFFNEFKKFISRGNVIDLAVGVIIGSAFTAFVVFCMVKAINTVQDKMTKKPEKEETPADRRKRPVPSACPRSISEPSAVPSVLPNSTNKTFRLLAGGRR